MVLLSKSWWRRVWYLSGFILAWHLLHEWLIFIGYLAAVLIKGIIIALFDGINL